MSRKGDGREDAVAESLFATLKHEYLALPTFQSHREAECAITQFIEASKNPVRQHSTLSNVSAVKYERQPRHPTKAGAPTCRFFGVKSTHIAPKRQ